MASPLLSGGRPLPTLDLKPPEGPSSKSRDPPREEEKEKKKKKHKKRSRTRSRSPKYHSSSKSRSRSHSKAKHCLPTAYRTARRSRCVCRVPPGSGRRQGWAGLTGLASSRGPACVGAGRWGCVRACVHSCIHWGWQVVVHACFWAGRWECVRVCVRACVGAGRWACVRACVRPILRSKACEPRAGFLKIGLFKF